MGTGKSLQALIAIALAHAMYKGQSERCPEVFQPTKIRRSLIVCPSTLVGHWAAEVDKYFPPQSLFKSLYLSGSRSKRLELWRGKLDSINIVIISYSVLRSDIDYLESENWCYCVLDEGHLLKNSKTGEFVQNFTKHF
jgi:TATA-binding protein-associated factor